ncbi:MAG: KEOPS complex N(6)-L-threonylcarbamoyladenine synthase Kae1 [Desulfurococcaceae archaeon]
MGVESTSHTFGVGIVELSEGRVRVLSSASSQYRPERGGIHPREAANHHVNAAPKVLGKALAQSGLRPNEIDALAVALGPGLGPCIRVGATLARFLSSYLERPLIPVNHAVAHVEIGKLVTGLRDPLIVYISGGNTMLLVQKDGRYRVFGETLDIPLGNLLDTFAREIGIAPPYVVEGKHAVDVCAEWANEFVELPYTIKGTDLSFSGLLTAALSAAKKAKRDRQGLGSVCASLRETAFTMLVEAAERVMLATGKREVLVVGGVAANRLLYEKFASMVRLHNAELGVTPPEYAGDNGVMIAYTGALGYAYGIVARPEEAFVRQRWRVDEVQLPWLGGTSQGFAPGREDEPHQH